MNGMQVKMENIEWSGYFPGLIGNIIALHAVYYHTHWGFDRSFETQVGSEVSAFIADFEKSRDGLWAARINGAFAGFCAVDGRLAETEGARLRWFIVPPQFHGNGIGRSLLQQAVRFARNSGCRRLFLWTFEGLHPARRLYESAGFTLRAAHPVRQWGQHIIEQQFELTFSTNRYFKNPINFGSQSTNPGR